MKLLWLAAGLSLALLIAIAAGALVVRNALAPATTDGSQTVFRVANGESLATIAANLEREGLIRNATAFEWLARYRGEGQALRAGEYWVSASFAPAEILDTLARGAVVTYEVTIPEGFTLDQIASRLEQAGLSGADAFRGVARRPETAKMLGVEGETLEGYLFPETYRMPRGLTPLEVARVLVAQFMTVWREIAPRASERELSMREVVTLASIVEKESGLTSERPLIASVFHNRLDRGMRLETDPTVIYGIPDFDGNLRRRDLENPDNPYNTYKIPGLPPGPIASPGAESLRAVVSPAESRYLFFVSRNDGSHLFSETYEEHAAAVNRFQRRRSR